MKLVRAYASNIISPYHRAGVLAFLKTFSSKGSPVKALIITTRGNWSHNLLEQERFSDRLLSVEVTETPLRVTVIGLFKALYALFFWRNKSFASCLVIGHSRVNIKLLAHLIDFGVVNRKDTFATVVVDEGIGSYGKWRFRFKVFCRENKPKFLHKLQYLFVYPFNQIFLKWSVLIDHDWRLLEKFDDDGNVVPRENVIRSYRQFFMEDAKKIIIPASSRGQVLLVTQPLLELEVMENEEYRDVLIRLRQCIEAQGGRLILKIHPAEQEEFFRNIGFDLIDNKMPAETVICAMNPLFIIGFASTLLIHSQLMFGVPSFGIIDLLSPESCSQHVLFEHPVLGAIFKKNVKFFENWEEFERGIEQIMS